MKHIFISLSLIILLSNGAFSQDYKTHKVKQGENIEDIARQYKVTPYDILVLNPDAKTNFQSNLILIIPESKPLDTAIEVEERQLLNYRSHKVKRKETIFGIAQRYGIEVEDIKKHNKRLYSEVLKKGDRIQIPQYSIVKTATNIGNTLKTYQVLQSEGKWRVAYKFGISVPELERLNPKMNDTLQLGDVLVVPNIADNEERLIDDTYSYYTVVPKEGFLSLYRKTGLTQEEIESLNEGLKETGLKAGMILKLPKEVNERLSDSDTYEETSLINDIVNYKTKNIALMLPFQLHRIDIDSTKMIKQMMRKDNSLLNIVLDFHSGVLMAIDSAKQLGISTKLDVFDTKARVSDISRIISDNDFSNYNAVIGPFIANNFDRAASMLRSDQTPIISPVTKPENLYSNVFQTIPSQQLLFDKIVNSVEEDSLVKHVIIVADSDSKTRSDALKQKFPRAKQIFSRRDKEGKEMHFNIREDFEEEFKPGLNVVFLETNDNGYVSNISSMLSSFIDEELEIDVVLMTTDKNRAFEADNISNNDLSKLRFQYPSINKPYDLDVENTFAKRYKTEFKTNPNRYAIRGFDVTMDVLLRLASTQKHLFDASDNAIETEYIENKFRYSKKPLGGYYNETAYLVKYQDLKIVEVKK